MSAEVGTKITIRYDALKPDMLYSFSWKKIGIALAWRQPVLSSV